jgi:hypothetical protein
MQLERQPWHQVHNAHTVYPLAMKPIQQLSYIFMLTTSIT